MKQSWFYWFKWTFIRKVLFPFIYCSSPYLSRFLLPRKVRKHVIFRIFEKVLSSGFWVLGSAFEQKVSSNSFFLLCCPKRELESMTRIITVSVNWQLHFKFDIALEASDLDNCISFTSLIKWIFLIITGIFKKRTIIDYLRTRVLNVHELLSAMWRHRYPSGRARGTWIWNYSKSKSMPLRRQLHLNVLSILTTLTEGKHY